MDAAMSAKFCNFADNFIGDVLRHIYTTMPYQLSKTVPPKKVFTHTTTLCQPIQ